MKTFALLTAVLAVIPSTFGFAPISRTTPKTLATTRFSSAIPVELEDENTYRYILAKAKECAFSDVGNAKEAKAYLNSILELESGCISGVLDGHDICDNVDEMAEVVAHLRQKAEMNQIISPLERSAGSTMMMLIAVSMLFAAGLEHQWQQGAQAFTFQEWWWAAKDGYLDTMVAHFIRNGGL